MKFIALLLFVMTMGTAFGQNLHMIEFSTNSAALGALTFSERSDNNYDTQGFVGGNYAYKISPRIQLGIQGLYTKYNGSVAYESYDFMGGVILNGDDDLTKAMYASLYLGMDWTNQYGLGNTRYESIQGKLAVGKRFALSNINLPNVTYSPEISYTRTENTKSSYGNNTFTIRFLQFSVFF
ncbi:MAG: hypothetical protein V4598_19240 [Bdellovibrionota bacterium]